MSGGPIGGGRAPQVNRGNSDAMRGYASSLRRIAARLSDQADAVDGVVSSYLLTKEWAGRWKDGFLGVWSQISIDSARYQDALAMDDPNLAGNPRLMRLIRLNNQGATGQWGDLVTSVYNLADYCDWYASAIDKEREADDKAAAEALFILGSIIVATVVTLCTAGGASPVWILVGGLIVGFGMGGLDYADQVIHNEDINHEGAGSFTDINVGEVALKFGEGFVIGCVTSIVAVAVMPLADGLSGLLLSRVLSPAGTKLVGSIVSFGTGGFFGDLAGQRFVSDVTGRPYATDYGEAFQTAAVSAAFAGYGGGLKAGQDGTPLLRVAGGPTAAMTPDGLLVGDLNGTPVTGTAGKWEITWTDAGGNVVGTTRFTDAVNITIGDSNTVFNLRGGPDGLDIVSVKTTLAQDTMAATTQDGQVIFREGTQLELSPTDSGWSAQVTSPNGTSFRFDLAGDPTSPASNLFRTTSTGASGDPAVNPQVSPDPGPGGPPALESRPLTEGDVTTASNLLNKAFPGGQESLWGTDPAQPSSPGAASGMNADPLPVVQNGAAGGQATLTNGQLEVNGESVSLGSMKVPGSGGSVTQVSLTDGADGQRVLQLSILSDGSLDIGDGIRVRAGQTAILGSDGSRFVLNPETGNAVDINGIIADRGAGMPTLNARAGADPSAGGPPTLESRPLTEGDITTASSLLDKAFPGGQESLWGADPAGAPSSTNGDQLPVVQNGTAGGRATLTDGRLEVNGESVSLGSMKVPESGGSVTEVSITDADGQRVVKLSMLSDGSLDIGDAIRVPEGQTAILGSDGSRLVFNPRTGSTVDINSIADRGAGGAPALESTPLTEDEIATASDLLNRAFPDGQASLFPTGSDGGTGPIDSPGGAPSETPPASDGGGGASFEDGSKLDGPRPPAGPDRPGQQLEPASESRTALAVEERNDAPPAQDPTSPGDAGQLPMDAPGAPPLKPNGPATHPGYIPLAASLGAYNTPLDLASTSPAVPAAPTPGTLPTEVPSPRTWLPQLPPEEVPYRFPLTVPAPPREPEVTPPVIVLPKPLPVEVPPPFATPPSTPAPEPGPRPGAPPPPAPGVPPLPAPGSPPVPAPGTPRPTAPAGVPEAQPEQPNEFPHLPTYPPAPTPLPVPAEVPEVQPWVFPSEFPHITELPEELTGVPAPNEFPYLTPTTPGTPMPQEFRDLDGPPEVPAPLPWAPEIPVRVPLRPQPDPSRPPVIDPFPSRPEPPPVRRPSGIPTIVASAGPGQSEGRESAPEPKSERELLGITQPTDLQAPAPAGPPQPDSPEERQRPSRLRVDPLATQDPGAAPKVSSPPRPEGPASSPDGAQEARERHTRAAEEELRSTQVERREQLLRELQEKLAQAPPEERARIRREYAEARRQLVEQQELETAGLRVLAFIDEWDPHKGGVVSVNRNLCQGLVEAGHEVFCRVGHEVSEGAVDGGVHLIGSRTSDPGHELRDRLVSDQEDLPPGVDVVIGHSRFSGPAALQVRDERYPEAQLVHLVHMVTEALARVQGRPEKGLENQEIERRLVAAADLAVGVGPVLFEEVQRLADMSESEHAPASHELIPGVEFEEQRPPPIGQGPPNLLLFGRADDPQKGALEAARMVRELGVDAARLTVRGARPETVERAKRILSEEADQPVDVRPYTVDRAEILADLREADVMVMPSRAEGFGLTALEAAGAGVPILVPSTSGLGRFVGDSERFPAEVADESVVEQGFEEPVPVERWVERLRELLGDLPRARELALELQQCLREQNRTWKGAAETLVAVVRALPERRPGRPTGEERE